MPAPSLLLRWTRVGAACGFLAALSYALGSAGLSADLDLVTACVLGPALMGFSMGLYHVLRTHRRTVSLDLGLMANLAAGVTVTVMLLAQLGLTRWFELQFGTGSTDSSERALQAAFEAGNGIQLGLDVAWDVFLVLGAVLLACNMWYHPRFGRILAVSGCAIAAALIVTNLAVFPEPPGHNVIDLGPVIGLWYLIVTVRLAMSGQWAAEHEVSDA
ncbi:MAG TPA: hypothetical protein VF086_02460 [Propionibacteriaceae bacterium]